MLVFSNSECCFLVGELGWEFYVKNEDAVHLYEGLVEAGKEFDIGHVGSYAINSLRLEKGFRLWGAEVCFLHFFF